MVPGILYSWDVSEFVSQFDEEPTEATITFKLHGDHCTKEAMSILLRKAAEQLDGKARVEVAPAFRRIRRRRDPQNV